MILITSADQYLGHCVASHLAEYRYLRPQLRLLCRDKSVCLGFAKRNIDVQQVDYTHPHELSVAFRGVEHVILAVGNEADRVAIAKNICKVADRSGVKSIVCVSHVGAAAAVDYPHLQHFGCIEDSVINSRHCDWVILRPDWLYQHFHLWARDIETHRKIALPLAEKDEIYPLDIGDLCAVIERLLVAASDETMHIRSTLQDEHVGQVYTLTGPESVSSTQLVRSLIQGTGYSKFHYQSVRAMDTGYYLQGLVRDIWFEARIKQEHQRMYADALDDQDYRTRAFNAPTDMVIQTWLEYFDWVRASSSSIPVSHAKMLLSPKYKQATIQEFFVSHGNSFKPRV